MKKEISSFNTRMFPFMPFTVETAVKLSRFLNAPANFFLRLNPSLKADLGRLEIDLNQREYVSVGLLNVLSVFIMVFLSIFSIGVFFVADKIFILRISLILAIMFSSFIFVYNNVYPKMEIIKQGRRVERDLLFALRYLTIRVRSGISLYDAMVGVAHGNYGDVSKEFRKAVKEISGGVGDIDALENLALRTTSSFFRRVIWQISSNMRTGSDISDVLSGITISLVKEHRILIRKYGSELNPIILMYMMFSVIVPALSITVLVVMSSFAGIKISYSYFYIIPIVVFVLQLFFLSIIKGKRPVLSL